MIKRIDALGKADKAADILNSFKSYLTGNETETDSALNYAEIEVTYLACFHQSRTENGDSCALETLNDTIDAMLIIKWRANDWNNLLQLTLSLWITLDLEIQNEFEVRFSFTLLVKRYI
jgi:hypothetical protein